MKSFVIVSPLSARTALLATSALFTLCAAPAIAQTASPAEPGATELQGATVTDSALDEAETLYVVTTARSATKTDTPLINVPQSVNVITVHSIQDRSANSIGEAIAYIPGVQTAQGENNRETLVFRGNSTTGDFFVDGIRDDVQTYRDLYNIQRLEVFKGPNAMIFGRGGIGGVVNRVTKQADWDRRIEGRLEGGSYDFWRGQIDVNQPLNDSVAVRLTGVYQDASTYRDDTKLDRWGINPTVSVKLGPDTKVMFGYEHFKDERTAERGVPAEPRINGITATDVIGPLKTRRGEVFGDPKNSPTWTNTDAVNFAIEHDFTDKISIRSRVRYADYDKFYQNVFPGEINKAALVNDATLNQAPGLPAGTYAPGTVVQISAYNNATRRKNLFNQTDFNAEFETGSIKHTLLIGAEFGRQTTDSVRLEGRFPNGAGPDVASIFAPVDDANIRRPDVKWIAIASSSNSYSVAKVAAGYIQDQIEFAPWLQAIVGIRYDHFNVKLHDRRSLAFRTTTSTSGAVTVSPERYDVTNNLWSPRAGLILKPVENASIYIAYSRTYQPRAGDQLGSLSLSNATLKPEKFDNYEIGAKWDVLPGLNVTAAIYELKRTNVIVPIDPNNAALGNELGGAQRTKGVELSVAGNITPNWSVMGAYAYQDGKFTKAISAAVPAGSRLANLPKQSASLWTRYDIPSIGLGAGIGVIHQGGRYASTDNLVRLPSFTRVDAALFYTITENLRAQVNVENLFDEKYFLNANSNQNISPGSPTAFKAAITASF